MSISGTFQESSKELILQCFFIPLLSVSSVYFLKVSPALCIKA